MQTQFNSVFSQRTNWLLKVNFLLIKSHVKLGLKLISDCTRSNSAEHLAIFAGFNTDNRNQFGEAAGKLSHMIELFSFALSTTLLQRFQTALVGTSHGNGKTLGN